MSDLTFIMIGQERGDCTASYEVKFPKEYTVRQFVNEIITNHKSDWGFIGIACRKTKHTRFTDLINGFPRCSYDHSELTEALPDYVMDKKIIKITGDGGWTRMDYLLTIDETENDE